MSNIGIKRCEYNADMTGVRNFVKFITLVALFGILSDSALGHALLWENDPYWTYWITKTFLIATVFALGTAWLGVGPGKGAIITAIHTVILTIYYWSFSPVGLPRKIEWLDLEHTWTTGIPIHFIVIYIGYLVALWLWRQSGAGEIGLVRARPIVIKGLLAAIVVVLVLGSASSLFLYQFVGATWFVTRLLIVYMFLLFFLVYLPQTNNNILVTSLILALILTIYSHWLSPLGLPGTWRVLNEASPQTNIRWLNYKELWLYQFPIYLLSNLLGLWLAKKWIR